MSKPNKSSPMTSAKALEAAETIRPAKLNEEQKIQPSRDAVEILAKMVANRARREKLEGPPRKL